MFPSKGFFHNVFYQPYNDRGSVKLQNSLKDSKHLVQRLGLEKVLAIHNGPVNSVEWNDAGNLLLTAGNDKHIVITNPFTYEVVVDYETQHKAHIFCAKFLPTSNNHIISSSGDGSILNLDLERIKATEKNFFTCHGTPCYKLETIPGERKLFLSCSEDDGTIRQYDLRRSVKCSKEHCTDHTLIDCGKPVSTIAINPIKPYQLAIATMDNIVRIVDRRKIMNQNPIQIIVPDYSFTVPYLNRWSYRITSLSYSPDGSDVLASYSNEEIYLFSINNNSSGTLITNDFLAKTSRPTPYRQISLAGNWSDTGPLCQPSIDSNGRSEFPTIREVINIQSTNDIIARYRTLPKQNWKPNYEIEYTERDLSNIFMAHDMLENNETMDDEDLTDDSSNDINIEQSTSNSHNKSVSERKLIASKQNSRFDDFILLQPIKAQYKGHRNSRTLIKEATFWGNDFIMSASDCGHVFVWDRHTCDIVMLLIADSHAVNCIHPHPSRPILATSGIDHSVKLWSPQEEHVMFSPSYANELVEKNQIMKYESKITAVVSPVLIILLIAYFNHIAQENNASQAGVLSLLPRLLRILNRYSSENGI